MADKIDKALTQEPRNKLEIPSDAEVALNNAKRRVDPEFAAAERARDLGRLTDDFEEVGQSTFGKYNDQIKNIKLP